MAIVLNSKTYDSFGFDPNSVYQWVERSGGVPTSFSKLTSKVNLGTGKAASSVKWKIAVPITVPADSECGCTGDLLRTYYVTVEVGVPAGSVAAERDDIRARLASLVASTPFVDSIEDLTQPSS